MIFLRDRWRRNAIHQYFATLEPIDRATILIVLALCLAIGLSFNAIAHSRASTLPAQPRLTAPPFSMDFADLGATTVA